MVEIHRPLRLPKKAQKGIKNKYNIQEYTESDIREFKKELRLIENEYGDLLNKT